MNLFDILTNPIMIIVVIGIVSKMFKNQRSGDQNSRQPSPKLDPMHPKHFEQKRAYQNKTDLNQKPVIVAKDTSYQSKVYEPPETNAKNTEISFKRQESEKKVSQIGKQRPIHHHTNHDRVPKVTKSSVVEGVIWAEVLGPPRAHKKWSQKR